MGSRIRTYCDLPPRLGVRNLDPKTDADQRHFSHGLTVTVAARTGEAPPRLVCVSSFGPRFRVQLTRFVVGRFEKTSQRRSLFALVGLCCEMHSVSRGPGSHCWEGAPAKNVLKCKNTVGAFPHLHRPRKRGQSKRKPIGFASIPAYPLRADSTKTPQGLMLKMLQNAVKNATFGHVSVLLGSCGVYFFCVIYKSNGRNHPVSKIKLLHILLF